MQTMDIYSHIMDGMGKVSLKALEEAEANLGA
jgi:hypothetical protein